MMTDHEILVAVRNDLEKGGRCQGTGRDPVTGALCVGYAIVRATGSDNWFELPEIPAARIVYALAGLPVEADPSMWRGQFAGWNDRSTDAEVFAVLDEGIALTAPSPPDPTWSELTEASESVAFVSG